MSVSSQRPTSGRSPFRVIVVASVGVSLLGAAYQSAFANSSNSRVRVMGFFNDYNPGGQGDEDDDGLSSGEKAAIAGGAAAGVAGGLFAAGVIGGGAVAGAALTSDRLSALPADQNRITQLRVVPRAATIKAGDSRSFFAEAKSATDGKWYSVTNRPETTFTTAVANPHLIKQDGSKNIFSVPLETPASADGQQQNVLVTFTPAGISPSTAEATVTIRVPAK